MLGKKMKVEGTLKTFFLFTKQLVSKKCVAPMTVVRKLGDVISFELASYINSGQKPTKTVLKQMAMCVNARK